jgi:uncharacterized protein
MSTVTSAVEHPNAVRLRGAFAAFARGELDAVLDEMADDAAWSNAGSSPIAGTHRGRDGITEMFVRLFTLTEGTYRTELLSVFADDQRAVAVYDATSTVAGRTETLRWVLVDEIGPDGKIAATYTACYDQERADAFLSGGTVPQQG